MRPFVSALVLVLLAVSTCWAADLVPGAGPPATPPATAAPAAAAPAPAAALPAAPATPAPAPIAAAVEYPHYTLRNDLVEVEISSRQGSLISFSLLDTHPIRQRDWQNARLIAAGLTPRDPRQSLNVLDDFNPAGGKHNWLRGIALATGADATPWTRASPASPASADGSTLVLEHRDGAKSLYYRMTYTLPAGGAVLSTLLEIDNRGSADIALQPSLIPLNGIHQDDPGSDAAYLAVAFHSGGANGAQTSLSVPKPAAVQPIDPGAASLDYIALKSRFFAALYEPGALHLRAANFVNSPAAPATSPVPDKAPVGESGGPGTVIAPVPIASTGSQPKGIATGFAMSAAFGSASQAYVVADYGALTLKPGDSLKLDWKLIITTMRQVDLARLSDVERQVEYTDGYYKFFKILAKMLTACLNGVYLVVRNYGLALVVLTFLIKLALHRTTFKQHESMMKMQKLSPDLKLIQAQYKDDKQKLAQKQMELWKKHGVNPLGGCLPVFIQMPIFIALYQAFCHSADMRGQTFLWINDLTLPDQVFGFVLMGTTLTLNPLPLIYIAVTIWMSLTQKLPSGGDPQQEQMAKMMRWMPVVFGAIFYNMPSGLVLYFTINAILSTIEIKMVKRKLGMG
jgi:YidC/Oxa1 family membrane protein insertase